MARPPFLSGCMLGSETRAYGQTAKMPVVVLLCISLQYLYTPYHVPLVAHCTYWWNLVHHVLKPALLKLPAMTASGYVLCCLLMVFVDGVIQMTNGCTRTGIWWYIYSSRQYESKLLWQIYGSIFDRHTLKSSEQCLLITITLVHHLFLYTCISHLLCSYQMPYSYHVELFCSLLS